MPAVALPLLSCLLERYAVQLETELEGITEGHDDRGLETLSEDIHWLLLISGNHLSQGSCVPDRVIRKLEFSTSGDPPLVIHLDAQQQASQDTVLNYLRGGRWNMRGGIIQLFR